MALPLEKQIEETVGRSRHALVVFRKEWTVDAAASAVALARTLERRGKKVDVVADGFSPSRQISFLPDVGRVSPDFGRLRQFVISLNLARAKVDELTYSVDGDKLHFIITPKSGQFRDTDVLARPTDYKYDLVLTIGTPDLGSLGRLFSEHPELFYRSPIINIDHDSHNENYGNINAVDITAASCAEIVHRLIVRGSQPPDPDTATALLTGIISATRSFRDAAVTPMTLDAAAELVAAGARRDHIVQNLYKTRSLATLKLWGRALARIKYDPEVKMTWSVLVRQDFVHAGSSEDCLPDVLNELMVTAPEAEIAALVYERDDADGSPAGACAILTSDRHSDATRLLAGLRPTGHRRLARVPFPKTNIQDAEREMLNAVRRSLGKSAGAPRLAKTNVDNNANRIGDNVDLDAMAKGVTRELEA